MPRTSAVKQAIAELSDFAQIYDFLEKYNRSIGNDESTFNRYIAQLAKFCVIFKRYPDQVSNEEYIGYYNDLRQSNPSGGTLKLAVYGVRMYFDAKNIVPPRHAIPPIKEPKRVPTYLTEEEALTLVLCGENRKVKVKNGALLAWGLRAQELVDLKLEDIDLKAGLVCIRASKGKKDRIIPTPPLYNRILENYIKEAKPTTYLIEKEDGAQVTVGYLRYCLKKAAIKSKINKSYPPAGLE